MPPEFGSEPSQFRVTLFVGPQPVEGKPSTQSTVFNVKKRSWKGGIQVSVEVSQPQLDAIGSAVGFPQWSAETVATAPPAERLSYQDRAQELFVQAVSRCKLDLLLAAGVAQENQRLAADTFVEELNRAVMARRDFITSHVATELDLMPDDSNRSA